MIPIPGYGGRYLIDRSGSVFTAVNTRGNRLSVPRKLKIDSARNGYPVVQLRWNGRNEHRRVEALIALAFEGKKVSYKPGRPKIDLYSHYQVSGSGCWIWKGGRVKGGYGCTSHSMTAHRIYYEHFVGPIPDGMCVCHHCDNPPCVNPAHLFLGTPLDNNNDKVAKGRQVKGTDTRSAKLDEKMVTEIFNSNEPCRVLAERYGVADGTISSIRLGKTWKHVERPPGYRYTPYRAPGDHTRWEDLRA